MRLPQNKNGFENSPPNSPLCFPIRLRRNENTVENAPPPIRERVFFGRVGAVINHKTTRKLSMKQPDYEFSFNPSLPAEADSLPFATINYPSSTGRYVIRRKRYEHISLVNNVQKLESQKQVDAIASAAALLVFVGVLIAKANASLKHSRQLCNKVLKVETLSKNC